MRGFDKLEEGRSRVLVYQVGSNRLYIVDYILGCYQMAVLGGLLGGSQWIHSYYSGCQQSLLDPVGSSWILVGSMCILVGSLYILVDLSWIHVYPVGSLYILVEPLQTLVYPLLDPCRSLQIFSISTCIFIYLLYPYQSTLIHSYPPYPSILYLLISILCNRSILPSSSRHY